MGNSSSKAAGQSLRNAAQTPARKYPSRIPQNTGFVGNNISEPAGRDVPTAETKRAHQDRDAPPQASPPSPSQMPQHREQASSFRSPAIDLDARDPHLASNLSRLGPVQPNPTLSPSSTTSTQAPSPFNNRILSTLAARQRLASQVEQDAADAGTSSFLGKRMIDVGTLRKALVLRDEQGMPEPDIEKILGLRAGVMKSLGRRGVVEVA